MNNQFYFEVGEKVGHTYLHCLRKGEVDGKQLFGRVFPIVVLFEKDLRTERKKYCIGNSES